MTTPAESDLPLIISVDDHVLEPKRPLAAGAARVAARPRARRSSREKVKLEFTGGHYGFTRDDPDGHWCDLWLFDDLVVPTGLLHAPAGMPREEQRNVPAVYEDFRPGTYDQTARLADMAANHVEAAINYPNIFPRFAGQGFLERDDKDLALACLRIYNDWMIDEWCGGAGRGPPHPAHPRAALGPGTWPPRRSGAARPRAATPSPSPRTRPSSACRRCTAASGTCCGRRARRPTPRCRCTSARRRRCRRTSPDAPLATSMSLNAQNAQGSLCDWVFSGTLARFPDLKIAYAESQVGWMPFQLERMDSVWRDGVGGVELPVAAQRAGEGPGVRLRLRRPARPEVPRRGRPRARSCSRPTIPHSDGTFPHSRKVAHGLFAAAGMDAEECRKFLRGNAIAAYGLERFGITE